jgi:hypothetical protein
MSNSNSRDVMFRGSLARPVRKAIFQLCVSRLFRQCGIFNNSTVYTACYGDNFTFLCVDDVLTSQETNVWASIACYGDSFTSYM